MCGLAGPYGLCIVCRRPAFNFCLQTGDPLCGRECKFKNFGTIEALEQSDAGKHATALSFPAPDVGSSSCSAVNAQLRQDALLLFQTLCKFSMQDEPISPTGNPFQPVDQRFVRSKRLSLELLLAMLQGGGSVFRTDERFIGVIRSLLCISLIKNCVSPLPRIFGQSLSIFLHLTVRFKVTVYSCKQ